MIKRKREREREREGGRGREKWNRVKGKSTCIYMYIKVTDKIIIMQKE